MTDYRYWRAEEVREEDAVNPESPAYHKADRKLERGRMRTLQVRAEIQKRRWLD